MAHTGKFVKTGQTIEVGPGKTVAGIEIPREEVPRYGFRKLMGLPDGTYTPVLQTWSQTGRMGADISQRLGLDLSSDTLRRLIEAEFIQAVQIAPKVYLLDLESVYQHIEACRDRALWQDAKRVSRDLDALR